VRAWDAILLGATQESNQTASLNFPSSLDTIAAPEEAATAGTAVEHGSHKAPL